MEYESGTIDLKARVERLEGRIKAFWITIAVFSLVFLSQVWLQTRAKPLQGGEIVRASRFEVVNAAGETIAEFGQKDGGTQLVLHHNSHHAAAEFSMTGLGPRIVFYDEEQKQRAAFELTSAPTLSMHDRKGNVRALLTADDALGSVFWVKDKEGFAAVLGNTSNEARRTERVDGKEVHRDSVQSVPGVTIRIQDAQRKVLWKAP